MPQQECIPVGCVPYARWLYPIVSNGVFCPPTPPNLRYRPPLEADPLWMQTPLDADPPWMQTPPVNRMTHRCKNITLPQTSFAGDKNHTSPKVFLGNVWILTRAQESLTLTDSIISDLLSTKSKIGNHLPQKGSTFNSLPPANVVCEGYVFTRVCHSFCSQGGRGGWYPSMQWANPPPGWRTTTLPPRWRTTTLPPDGEPPLGGEPPPPLGWRPPPDGEPPPPPGWRNPPPPMVTVRAVRILLECILV